MISFFSRLFKKAPSKAARSAAASNHAASASTNGPANHNGISGTHAKVEPDVPQHYCPELIDIALNNNSSKHKTAARQRIAKLLEEETLTLAQVTRDAANTNELLTLCSFSEKAAAEILSAEHTQSALASLANEAATAAIRKAAAEKVTERTAIEAMLKGAKGKDKHVYKIAKAALAVFKAEDEALAQKHAEIASLCNDAERHGKKPFDHLYTHKFINLEKAWQDTKSDATPELHTRFDNAIAKCQAVIDAEIAKEHAKAQAEESANAAIAGIHAATQAVSQLAAELYDATQWTTDRQQQAEQQLKTQSDNVRSLISRAQSEIQATEDTPESIKLRQTQQKKQQAAQQYFYQVSEATHGLLNKIAQGQLLSSLTQKITQNASTEPEKADQPSANNPSTEEQNIAHNNIGTAHTHKTTELEHVCNQIAELLAFSSQFKDFTSTTAQKAQAAIADWQKAQKAQAAARKALISNISDLMRRASSAARNGQVRRARGIYRELDDKRKQIPSIPQGLASKLEDLDTEIAKLGDWHEFAVTPKKQALVDTMNSLHNSTLAPDDLAAKIHSLQDEWRLLCKGGENQDAEIWQAFQASADKAFEPCKIHFAKQAQARENNAQARLDLIAQMNNYYDAYDWRQAIWKDVEQTLRVAKDTWKTLWPVPRQQQKEIQTRFDAVLDKIYAHMNAAFDTAKVQKEQLIAQAQSAAQNPDIKAAAEQIKQLQANWKHIGRSYRKADQQLWAAFRSVCDEVFNKRQAIFDEANAERDQLIIQSEAQIEKLITLSQKPGKELQTLSGQVNEITEAFYALGELPKAQVVKLQKALQSIEANIEQYRNSAKEQVWGVLFELNSQLNTLEAAEGDITEQTEAFNTQLQAQKLPGNSVAILTKRLTQIATPNDNAVKQLRLLCIRAEIAQGIDSPESDKQLRMEYQVEALQQSFGSSQNDTPATLTAQWLAVNGCSSTEFNTLQARFIRCCFPQLSSASASA
ncbi:DUF349 domain-containing protein [Marinagarivorans algicola]|uniref:DUF349 domain-containing protein n=1 Tax=Marinagarivorans algicola TaxID=1513270 RepID=UPI00373678DC